jgi:hypothetical protein
MGAGISCAIWRRIRSAIWRRVSQTAAATNSGLPRGPLDGWMSRRRTSDAGDKHDRRG